MASKPTVRWNESNGRWMAWVASPTARAARFERVDKATAQRDLDELLTLRAPGARAAATPATGGFVRSDL